MQYNGEIYYNLIRHYVISKFPSEIEFEPEAIMSFGFSEGMFSDKNKDWKLIREDVKTSDVFENFVKTYYFTDPQGTKQVEYNGEGFAYYISLIEDVLKYMVANDYLASTTYGGYIAKDKLLKNKKIEIVL